MPASRNSIYFFLIILLIVLLVMARILMPLFDSLVVGAILAGLFIGLHRLMVEKLPIPKLASSLILCLIINVLVIIPGVFLVTQSLRELASLYQLITQERDTGEFFNYFFGQGAGAQFLNQISETLGIPFAADDVKGYVIKQVGHYSTQTFSYLNQALANFLTLLFHFFMVNLTIFAIFQYGEELKRFVFDLSPLPEDEEKLLMTRFNQINYLTLVGNGIGALLQAIPAGFILYACNVPSSFFWTLLMIFMAFLPIVGMSIVYIPASLYLFLNGNTGQALFVLIACSVIALLVENWFKPQFIGNKIKINSIFVLFCIIGGIATFGVLGIFYGPLAGILFQTMATFYRDRYQHQI